MPLAPEAKAVLDWIAAAKTPPYDTLPPAEARLQYRETRKLLTPPLPDVAGVQDRAIPGPHGPIPIRCYRPLGSKPDDVLPVLVFFHGGGWTIGDLETHDWVCRSLANETPCSVVAVDYRLGPEHKFPKAVDDAFAATRWVAENAGDLAVDGGRLAVAGDSAGGNLAAVVTLIARDEGGPGIAFQLLIYPGTKIEADFPSLRDFGDGYLLTTRLITWFRECYVRGPEDCTDWRTSPLLARDHSRLPPALVITGEYDPLLDEGRAYADRLQSAGVSTTYSCYPGMIHGFLTMARVIPVANAAIREGAQALASAFRVHRKR
jgi:acetyl esterase